MVQECDLIMGSWSSFQPMIAKVEDVYERRYCLLNSVMMIWDGEGDKVEEFLHLYTFPDDDQDV